MKHKDYRDLFLTRFTFTELENNIVQITLPYNFFADEDIEADQVSFPLLYLPGDRLTDNGLIFAEITRFLKTFRISARSPEIIGYIQEVCDQYGFIFEEYNQKGFPAKAGFELYISITCVADTQSKRLSQAIIDFFMTLSELHDYIMCVANDNIINIARQGFNFKYVEAENDTPDQTDTMHIW